MNKLTHIDKDGSIKMVDVASKKATKRIAIAQTKVVVSNETMTLLKKKAIPKGDVFNTAKVAGILAAKKTDKLIPLCHPLQISFIDIEFKLEKNEIVITSEVKSKDKTGLEMEALIACQIAALTIYDMCKAIQKDILITDCKLVYKEGGKSGKYINKN